MLVIKVWIRHKIMKIAVRFYSYYYLHATDKEHSILLQFQNVIFLWYKVGFIINIILPKKNQADKQHTNKLENNFYITSFFPLVITH